MATDIKKFLDQQGVGTLWSKIVTKVNESVEAEAAIARAAEAANAKAIGDLDAKVGDLPEGTTAATVIEYVDKKTADIASGEAMILLANRVTEAEGAIDAIEADYLTSVDEAALTKLVTDEATTARAAESANAQAAKAADDKAVALAAKVGEVPADKTVVQMISDAQTAATYDDTKVKEDIQTNADAIALLNNNSDVVGSVDYKIAQAVAAIMENPDETMNSINELVTWINDHAADALELSNQVSTNKTDIAALAALVGSEDVATQITDAIAAALKVDGVDKYALASDLTAAIGRIAAIEADYLKAADKTELNDAIALKADKTYVDTELAKKATVTDLNAVSAVANAAATKTYVDTELGKKANQSDLEAEVTARQNAVKANTDAITAIKDHASVDSFADVMTEIAKKQDVIPANTYDIYGSAAQALVDAKAYSNANYALIQSLTTTEIEQAIASATV